ncbi:class I SAM-dependent methyltransferase [Pyxidicoccus sp. 3LG]
MNTDRSRLEQVQQMYSHSDASVRGRFGADVEQALAYVDRYTRYVSAHAPGPSSRILDVGCGGGWSTLVLRRLGHRAEGLDLHAHALEARALDAELPYTQGDATKLPFPDGTFDVVCMRDTLEHVPEPRKALDEAARVLRQGGRLIVVGPNLLSVPVNAYWSVRHTVRVLKSKRLWEQRTEDMPRHPGGNTMPESWAYTAHHLWHTARKLVLERNQPRFLMREPDSRPPFTADNDACYYCNPMDLRNWARQHGGLRVVQGWADDRRGGRWLWPVLGGTWMVLERDASA